MVRTINRRRSFRIIRMDSGAVKNVRFLVLASDGLWDVMSAQEAEGSRLADMEGRRFGADGLSQENIASA